MREAQQHDRLLQQVRKRLDEGKKGDFSLDESGALRFKGRLCVPQKAQVKNDILREAYRTPYTVHPGETKMYRDLKKELLVEENEGGCSSLCGVLRDLLAGKG